MMMHGHRPMGHHGHRGGFGRGPMGMPPPHRPPILPVGSIWRMNYLLRGGCCGCGGCLMTVLGAGVFMLMMLAYFLF